MDQFFRAVFYRDPRYSLKKAPSSDSSKKVTEKVTDGSLKRSRKIKR
jgi:hypothetical protein